MTICIWLLFIEEFSIRISSLPTNSYDDLHLPTLWEGSFQLGSIPFLQNSYDDLHLARCQFKSPPFPVNSYDDLHQSTLLKEQNLVYISPSLIKKN